MVAMTLQPKGYAASLIYTLFDRTSFSRDLPVHRSHESTKRRTMNAIFCRSKSRSVWPLTSYEASLAVKDLM